MVDHGSQHAGERLGVSGQPDQIFQLYRAADDALQKAMDDDRFKDADLTLAGVSGGKDVAIFYLRTINLAIDGGSEFFLDARMNKTDKLVHRVNLRERFP